MTQTGSTPPPPTPPPAPEAGTAWAAPPAPTTVGPAGFVYADVPNRAIAYIIDVIILAVIYFIVAIVLSAVGLSVGASLSGTNVIYGALYLVIGGGYFWYTWTRMRGTVGMKALGMQIGNAVDGKTLTNEQAVRRLIALAAPQAIAQAFAGVPGIGILLGLMAFAWFIFLLYTTAKSPTKQGFQDIFANSMVVKAARIA